MTEVREHVAVPRRCRGTRRGAAIHPLRPGLAEDPGRGVAIALRAAWLEPGWRRISRVSSCSACATGTASSPRSIAGALPARTWSMPTPTGTIGWKPAGRAPIRPAGTGCCRCRATAATSGPATSTATRCRSSPIPARGWVASANQMNLPPGYPQALAYEWAPPYRYERIAEALSAARAMERRGRGAAPDRLRVDAGAAGWSSACRRSRARSDVERRALALLRGLGLPPRRRQRRRRVVRGLAAPAPAGRGVGTGGAAPGPRRRRGARARVGDAPGPARGARVARRLPAEEVTAALLESLAAAAAEVEERLGADWSGWRWGRCTTAASTIPLAAPLRAKLGIDTAIGPLPRVGKRRHAGRHHLRASRLPAGQSGASVRVVIDVGAWDGSVAMNTPGQSGLPGSDALSGPLRQVGRRRDLPAALEPRSHRGRDHAADPSRSRFRRLNRPLSNSLSSAIIPALRWQRRPETKRGNQAGTGVAQSVGASWARRSGSRRWWRLAGGPPARAIEVVVTVGEHDVDQATDDDPPFEGGFHAASDRRRGLAIEA